MKSILLKLRRKLPAHAEMIKDFYKELQVGDKLLCTGHNDFYIVKSISLSLGRMTVLRSWDNTDWTAQLMKSFDTCFWGGEGFEIAITETTA